MNGENKNVLNDDKIGINVCKEVSVTGLTICSYFAPVTMVHAMITGNKCSIDIKSNHEIHLNAKYHEPKTDVYILYLDLS